MHRTFATLILFVSRIFLSFAAVAVTIIVIEFVLGMDNPIILYRMDLNDYVLRNDNILYEPRPGALEFNNDGIRNARDIPIEKPDNTYRIEVIGDSLAYGFGLYPPQTFASRLEEMLASSSGALTYEVLNLGVLGYNIEQIMTRLEEKGLKYQPDMVVYHHWLDDAYISDPGWASAVNNPLLRFDQYITDQGGLESGSRKIRLVAFLLNSRIGNRIVYAFRNAFPGPTRRDEERNVYKTALTENSISLHNDLIHTYEAGIVKDLPDYEPYYGEHVKEDNFLYWNFFVAKFANICSTQKITCVAVLSPVLYSHAKGEYNWSTLHRYISDAFRAHGINVLDVTDAFEAYDGRDLRVFPLDTEHPNHIGNQIIAETVKQFIIQQTKP